MIIFIRPYKLTIVETLNGAKGLQSLPKLKLRYEIPISNYAMKIRNDPKKQGDLDTF